ncbi:MAG: tryptophan-rich sensory protein [Gemmatimonadaceae bacterium]|nr:tryptophan-rich sensory protein [Acetobacteraceae bacterium]
MAALLLSAAGGLTTQIGPWYRSLRKPRLQPPDWLFGPVWTLILGMAAWAGVLAWEAAATPGARTRIIVLFAVNAFFHFLWTPIYFRLRRPDWALIEVTFLWSSCLAMVLVLPEFSRTAALFVAPYLAWVTFAAWLNYEIVRLNRPFGAA